MRYFVYYQPDTAEVRPYILAEVVRETCDDGQFREWSAAASIAGEGCGIFTREELLQQPHGARALMAWETLDDRQFDNDTQRLVASIDREEAAARMAGRHLRIVQDEPATAEFTTASPRLQWLAARRRILMIEALRLRHDAQTLIETAQARRQQPRAEKNAAARDEGTA